MFTFAVLDNNGPALDWPLRQAYMVGPDEIPLPADLECEGGLIRCRKRSPESAGLCVQFQVDASAESPGGLAPGLLSLRTSLLPPRERPYLLALELARHRLMLFLNKLEDWALSDLSSESPAMSLFERARGAFTEALSAHRVEASGPASLAGYSVEADRLSRHALSLAVEAGEALALSQGRVQYGRRVSGELAALAETLAPPANALTDHETKASRAAALGTVGVILSDTPAVGCAVSPNAFAPMLQQAVQAASDFVCLPMRWIDLEPSEGKYSFAKTDRWIEWAVLQAKLPVVAGPVIDFRPRCVPEWLYIWEHDYETLRDLVYEHVKNVVTRYRKTVQTWTIASGLHVNTNFMFSFEQVMDLTRTSVLLVRKLHPKAKIQIEIARPWGEYYADHTRSIPPSLYAEMINQAGVPIDALAVRLQMGHAEPGRSTRDLLSISTLLDRFGALDKPLAVTAMGAPSTPPDAEALGPGAMREPGYWREPWCEAAQERWLRHAAAVVLGKPFVQSMCWQDLCDADKEGEMAGGGLLNAQGQPKPAARRMMEIRAALREKKPPMP